MSDAVLPTPIQRFIDATNRGDTEAFVASFTEDAYLNDWGREFEGRSGVRSWDSTDNIGVRAHFDPVSAHPGDQDGEYVVTLTVTGDGFNGTGPFLFTIRDGLISRLVIS
ncbi:nuclear transport factor 2 family protein [Planctomonas sp. JC2975]|uniref:nuclear transport factor 2 family protein n=1 Tax=Planctomonas sp. JC2975 TaxID=2729626 RepID=UPI00147654D5|nr:nuclear transport factor 2 family protein [Planctomonas sp. JC2975]